MKRRNIGFIALVLIIVGLVTSIPQLTGGDGQIHTCITEVTWSVNSSTANNFSSVNISANVEIWNSRAFPRAIEFGDLCGLKIQLSSDLENDTLSITNILMCQDAMMYTTYNPGISHTIIEGLYSINVSGLTELPLGYYEIYANMVTEYKQGTNYKAFINLTQEKNLIVYESPPDNWGITEKILIPWMILIVVIIIIANVIHIKTRNVDYDELSFSRKR